MAFAISSPAFANGAHLPALPSSEGGVPLPALDWRGAPEGTESYAVIVEANGAPRLAIADIGPEHPGIEEGQSLAGFTVCTAPAGADANAPQRYAYRVLALDVPTLGVTPGDDARALLRAAEGHVMAEAGISSNG